MYTYSLNLNGWLTCWCHYCIVQAFLWQIAGIFPENLRVLKTDLTSNYALSLEVVSEAISSDLSAGLIPFFICATVRNNLLCYISILASCTHFHFDILKKVCGGILYLQMTSRTVHWLVTVYWLLLASLCWCLGNCEKWVCVYSSFCIILS